MDPVDSGARTVAGDGPPLLICLLGEFRLLQGGQHVPLRAGGKTQGLLHALALRRGFWLARRALLERLWPSSPDSLASQSLNSLLHSLHRRLGGFLGGAAPVLRNEDSYRLNLEAGVEVDVACFEAVLEAAEREVCAGKSEAAAVSFQRAIRWYKGDLYGADSTQAVIERERLRVLYLNLLARLADYHFERRDYAVCMATAIQLLSQDSCREDAHRLVMRCHVRQGQRAQAMRQYRLCEHVLLTEFEATPEPATRNLFDHIRLDPGSI